MGALIINLTILIKSGKRTPESHWFNRTELRLIISPFGIANLPAKLND